MKRKLALTMAAVAISGSMIATGALAQTSHAFRLGEWGGGWGGDWGGGCGWGNGCGFDRFNRAVTIIIRIPQQRWW